MSLFDGADFDAAPTDDLRDDPPDGRVVRVIPERPAVEKAFDYVVPSSMAGVAMVGRRVLIDLGGRRVPGWIEAVDVEPPPGVRLRAIGRDRGWGPSSEIVDLAGWVAHGWAGRRNQVLGSADPPRNITRLPPPITLDRSKLAGRPHSDGSDRPGPLDAVARDALGSDTAHPAVLRVPPATAPGDVVAAVLRMLSPPTSLGSPGSGSEDSDAASHDRSVLVVAPSFGQVRMIVGDLASQGIRSARLPDDWAQARSGAPVVIGTRVAAVGPCSNLAAIVVIAEHDEALAQETVPTWHARDLAAERARRAGVPCILVSSCPTVEATEAGPVFALSRRDEREGWPITELVDRRKEEPAKAAGLLSDALVPILRSDRRVVCVLNRKGRARLLACGRCRELLRCEACNASVEANREPTPATAMVCRRCGLARPAVCQACNATTLRQLRPGVAKLAEELEALARRPVIEISTDVDDGDAQRRRIADAGVIVGTEAALHRVRRADTVVFLDFDQELLAPRIRAVEQAMGLVVRAASLLGDRAAGGRLVLQTRQPDHEVCQAALHGDADRVRTAERERRRLLGYPPFSALAELSGAGAPAFAAALGRQESVAVVPTDDAETVFLARAASAGALADAIAATARPDERLRIAVNPHRA